MSQCHSSQRFAYDQVIALLESTCPWIKCVFREHDTSSLAFCTMGKDTLATTLEGRAVLSQKQPTYFLR